MGKRKQSYALAPDDVLEQLLDTVRKMPTESSNDEWTTEIVRALARLDSKLCVDPVIHEDAPTHSRAGEWLWDLTLSQFPRYSDRRQYRYPECFESIANPELVLVAECEWGKANSRRANGYEVMNDFLKLLSARCSVKVMVFAYFVGDGSGVTSSFEELTALMNRAIKSSSDPAEYVLLGVDQQVHECRWLIASQARARDKSGRESLNGPLNDNGSAPSRRSKRRATATG